MSDRHYGQIFAATEIVFAMDRDDPSIGQIEILTDEACYKFQLSRLELMRLARQIQKGLETTAMDQPEG